MTISATLATLLDKTMDLTVLPGYTNIGFRARRALLFPGAHVPMLEGRRALVTGASSGLGLATAEGLARLGATVHILARDPERGARAVTAIGAATGREAHLEIADLSSLDSVRSFAKGFAADHGDLHVLVNNAGVMSAERELSADGHELTFATNVLGMFLLTNELLPLLCASAPARVINVSSGGMYTARLDPSDLERVRGSYSGPDSYAQTKRAQVILTEMWAERLRGTGVAVHSMHPGWADTPGIAHSLPRFHQVTRPLLRTAGEGADTIVWLAGAEPSELGSGSFWHDRRRRPKHRVPWTRESESDRHALWEACRLATEPLSPQAEAILAGERA